MNRHAIRKYGGGYAVVFHHWGGIDYLYHGGKNQCKAWLKEQIKLIKAAR